MILEKIECSISNGWDISYVWKRRMGIKATITSVTKSLKIYRFSGLQENLKRFIE